MGTIAVSLTALSTKNTSTVTPRGHLWLGGFSQARSAASGDSFPSCTDYQLLGAFIAIDWV